MNRQASFNAPWAAYRNFPICVCLFPGFITGEVYSIVTMDKSVCYPFGVLAVAFGLL